MNLSRPPGRQRLNSTFVIVILILIVISSGARNGKAEESRGVAGHVSGPSSRRDYDYD
jgi:hypothetical protein